MKAHNAIKDEIIKKIIGCVKLGMKDTEIARAFKIHKDTVYRYRRKAELDANIHVLPNIGGLGFDFRDDGRAE